MCYVPNPYLVFVDVGTELASALPFVLSGRRVFFLDSNSRKRGLRPQNLNDSYPLALLEPFFSRFLGVRSNE